MRNLKDWLGHKVLVMGNIQKIETKSYCIDNVRVKEYSNNPEVRNIDHIWTFFSPDDKKIYADLQKRYPRCVPQLKEKIGFVGYVIEYRRRDGSKDYGIESIPTTSWILTGRKCYRIPARQREEMVMEIISLLKKREVFYDFEKKTLDEYLQELNECLVHIRWEIEIEKYSRRVAKETLAKTRKGVVTKDPIKFRIRKRELVKGFRS